MMISFGRWTIAQAMLSRRFMPPEKILGIALCLVAESDEFQRFVRALLQLPAAQPVQPAEEAAHSHTPSYRS